MEATINQKSTSEEIDAKTLLFLTRIYNLMKRVPGMTIPKVVLKKAADLVGLTVVPTQDILMTVVDWSVPPTMDTAIRVHKETTAYETKRRSTSTERKAGAEMVTGSLTEEMVRKMIQDMMPKTAQSTKELEEELEKANDRIAYLEGELDKMAILRNGLLQENEKLQEKLKGMETELDHNEAYEKMIREQIITFCNNISQIQSAFDNSKK